MANSQLKVALNADITDFENNLGKAATEIVNLKNKNEQLSKQLEKSKNQNKTYAVSFDDITSSLGGIGGKLGDVTGKFGDLGGVLGNLAGKAGPIAGIGVAVAGVVEVLSSSASNIRQWQDVWDTTCETVDGFLFSIVDGGMKSYLSNLDIIISKQKEALVAARNIQNTMLGTNLNQAMYENEKARLENKIEKTNDPILKSQYQSELKALEEKNKKYVDNSIEGTFENLEKVFEAELSKVSGGKYTDVNLDEVMKILLEKYATPTGEIDFEKLRNRANKVTQTATGFQTSNWGTIGSTFKKTEDAQKVSDSFEFNVLKAFSQMNMNDENGNKLQNFADMYQNALERQTFQIEQNTSSLSLLGEQTTQTTELFKVRNEEKLVQGGISLPMSYSKTEGVNLNPFSLPDTSTMRDELQTKIEEVAEEINSNPIKIQPFEPEPIKYDYEGKFSDMEQNANKASVAFGNLSNMFTNMSTAFESDALGKAAVGVSVAASIAQVIATFANALKGTVSPWDWIAAAAAGTATLVATVTSIKSIAKFADGGIVSSSSSVGDQNLIRVNGGEMILNNTQQQSLFSMINSGSIQGTSNQQSNVKFKIRGSDLYAVLKTYEDNR